MTLQLQGLTPEIGNAPIVTRFAPSPTGLLHMGHAYAAWVAREVAQQSTKGRFLLRFEDIDTPRVKSPLLRCDRNRSAMARTFMG